MNSTKGKKILLVDDDDALRQSLGEQLRLYEEFTIIEADNGTEALSLAKGEYFDAILLDVGLPDMDGREVCRLMRRSGVTSPDKPRSGECHAPVVRHPGSGRSRHRGRS